MRASLSIVLMMAPGLAVAQAPPAVPEPTPIRELPAQFICAVARPGPSGIVGAQRSVSEEGVPDDLLFSWETSFDDSQGFRLNASWSAAPRNYSLVQIMFNLPGERPRTYRLRLEEAARHGEPTLDLDSGPIPAEEGWTYVFTSWRTLTGLISDAYSPRFVVLADGEEVFRSAPIEPLRFQGARTAAEALEPDLAPLVADYRRKCQFMPAVRAPG